MATVGTAVDYLNMLIDQRTTGALDRAAGMAIQTREQFANGNRDLSAEDFEDAYRAYGKGYRS